MNHYAALRITDAHPCPHCGAVTGVPCTTMTGNATREPHILRVNMAKRAAVRGRQGLTAPCPADCGGSLTLRSSTLLVLHVGTWKFECEGS